MYILHKIAGTISQVFIDQSCFAGLTCSSNNIGKLQFWFVLLSIQYTHYKHLLNFLICSYHKQCPVQMLYTCKCLLNFQCHVGKHAGKLPCLVVWLIVSQYKYAIWYALCLLKLGVSSVLCYTCNTMN